MLIEIGFTGLVGIARSDQSLTAVMVDARVPNRLRLPEDVRNKIKDPHVPRLLFREAELVSSDLPWEEDAYSCIDGDVWQAIDTTGYDVTIPSLTGPALTWSYDLLRLRDLTQPLSGSPQDKEMEPSLLDVPYQPPRGKSRISSRVTLTRGVVTSEIGRAWKFEGQDRTVYRLVVVRAESTDQVVIECHRLHDPKHVRRIVLRGKSCELRFENNPPAENGGDTCRGNEDFVALYSLLRNPEALRRYPIPMKTGGGYAGDAQCSPVETKP